MNVITISAKARCGKDTAANYILSKLPNATSFALASSFKESIAKHFSEYMSRDDVFGNGVDRNNFIIYIHSTDLEDGITKVFADFGYDLDKYNIDFTRFDFNGWTIRNLMQVIGTDIGVNKIDTNIWLKVFETELFNLSRIYDTVVVTDCRQAHEIDYLREMGSEVIHLRRNTGLTDSHITERGLDPVAGEFIVDNNGTLEELYWKLDWILSTIDLERE